MHSNISIFPFHPHVACKTPEHDYEPLIGISFTLKKKQLGRSNKQLFLSCFPLEQKVATTEEHQSFQLAGVKENSCNSQEKSEDHE